MGSVAEELLEALWHMHFSFVSDFSDKFPGAAKQLATWLKEKKITFSETIVEGFDKIPQAFIDLFDGKNQG